MRAFVVTGPRRFEVLEVDPPVPGPGQVVVDVERAGVCGTDMEIFGGQMSYLHDGHARYPVRLGHEWCGTVSSAGEGVDDASTAPGLPADLVEPGRRVVHIGLSSTRAPDHPPPGAPGRPFPPRPARRVGCGAVSP
ncbi:alcohol dehydrogenase catalytic domain-containing protein [Streptosporangium sp. NPDC023615]|uniref:alcohol dehydrogenase catalytic domain-containing protein n=1 Tax=Streptosporangium sp. NPDC023615 TaxID=3154794 RepID=UPI00342BB422